MALCQMIPCRVFFTAESSDRRNLVRTVESALRLSLSSALLSQLDSSSAGHECQSSTVDQRMKDDMNCKQRVRVRCPLLCYVTAGTRKIVLRIVISSSDIIRLKSAMGQLRFFNQSKYFLISNLLKSTSLLLLMARLRNSKTKRPKLQKSQLQNTPTTKHTNYKTS